MDVRDRILENSLELFINKGCKSVTMDDIASENGISKRTLYEFFGDKSSLLTETIELYKKRMKESFEEIEKSSENVLEQFFKMHDSQTEVSVNLRINFFTELKKFYPEIYESMVNKMVCSHEEVIKDGIIKGQNQGVFRNNINLDLVSKIMLEFGNVLDNPSHSVKKYEKKEIFKEVYINYIRGLSTLKGIEIIDNFLNR
jgi:AcrR family transcriptional regulator